MTNKELSENSPPFSGLRILTGLAGTGKTAYITDEIRRAVLAKESGRLLLVPEQYSHEAERELCSICGDTLSLYAEVMSFTGLARALSNSSSPVLDKGGKLLCMALAVDSCFDRLTLLKNKARHPEMLGKLNSAIDILKASCITPEILYTTSQKCSGELKSKLTDLSILYEAYQGVLFNSFSDPADTLQKLAENIKTCDFINENSVIYIDGFTDFTRSELEVIREILRRNAKVTICLTLDSPESSNEIFAVQRASAAALIKIAKELGVEVFIDPRDADRSDTSVSPARLLADSLFSYTDKTLNSEGRIELYTAGSASDECRLAAAKVLELLCDCGYRRRDIAIAVRGFQEYSPILESTFEEYGIPIFTAERTPLTSKPLPLLISSAYDIINGGWKADDIITYLGTGLTGISFDDSDLLSSYIYRWNLRADAWHSAKDWMQHPDGYNRNFTDETYEILKKINFIRHQIAAPLLAFEKASQSAAAASGHAMALYGFLEGLNVAGQLDSRADELAGAGSRYEAEAYRQLWDTVITAIDQAYMILSDMPLSSEKFAEMFIYMLSTYDVGVIPISLDCVSAGDFDRMRRRNIKNLIVLGASSDRIPSFSSGGSLFTRTELSDLEMLGTQIGEKQENEMWREYSLIYNCISLPSERLIISCPVTDKDGNETCPSFIMERASKLFGAPVIPFSREEASEAALTPAMKLALSGNGSRSNTLYRYIESEYPGKLESIKNAAERSRGKLSSESIRNLYGKTPGISASRAEKFFSCKYGYFTQYGLKVQPFKKLDFSPSDLGTFTHYVLQHTAEEVRNSGGFPSVSDSFVEETAKKYIALYEEENLNGFSGKNERFIYLFHRYAEDTVSIAVDMARELRHSRFEPGAFEFSFSGFSPISLETPDGKTEIKLSGIADRIDLWESGENTYIRIADYKTGKKTFSLSDIWYGMSMQLILYLYVICSRSHEASCALGLDTDTALIPAGVMYVPASRQYISSEKLDLSDEELSSEHAKKLKCSGIVLCSDGVPDAWETGPETVYSPLKFKDGLPVGDSSVSIEQIELLYTHVKKRLSEMAEEICSGLISADPYDYGSSTACKYCDMKGICGFTDGENGEEFRRLLSIKTSDVWDMIREEVQNG
ncbi:MAG: PD-(D/E)XK nuclease family protein [Eubacteriales bacterium]|nr:PD-(D/E)XK nuclease family protein [Eubacteriales bacterium]